jgi:hypothetical protein
VLTPFLKVNLACGWRGVDSLMPEGQHFKPCERIADQLEAERQGTFDFNSLSHLISPSERADDGGDDG